MLLKFSRDSNSSINTKGLEKMATCKKYAEECQLDYQYYRSKCKAGSRGDGTHDLWVKLAWMNHSNFRYWRSMQ